MVSAEDHHYVKQMLENPNLTPHSKTQYLSSLRTLQKACRDKPLETMLERPDALLHVIRRKWSSTATRKAKITAVLALLKHVDGLQTKYAVCVKMLNEIRAKLNNKIEEKVMSGEPSKRERENMVPWSDVVDAFNILLKQQGTACMTDQCLVLAMYVLMEPLRADFGEIKLFSANKPPTESEKKELNFMVLGPGNAGTLVLNTYKTKSSYGAFQRDLPSNLVKCIRRSLKAKPRVYLFEQMNCEGHKPYPRNSYTNFANRMIRSIFEPKKMSISLLRHSFISSIDFNEATAAQLSKVASNMAHSVAMQQSYRRKTAEESEEEEEDPSEEKKHSKRKGRSNSPIRAEVNCSGIVAMRQPAPAPVVAHDQPATHSPPTESKERVYFV